jgi:hypothetical protein
VDFGVTGKILPRSSALVRYWRKTDCTSVFYKFPGNAIFSSERNIAQYSHLVWYTDETD